MRRRLAAIVPRPMSTPDKFFWATVEAVTPMVTVRPDGSQTLIAVAPGDNMVGPVYIGQRVWCQAHLTGHDARRVMILSTTEPSAAPVSFTPVLRATTTNPNLGTGGEAIGQYVVSDGWCHGWARIRFGTSGVDAGSGTYSVVPPVEPSASLPRSGTNGENATVGHGMARDNSNAAASTVIRVALAGNGNFAFHSTSGITLFGDSTPWAWAANDRLSFQFSYPVA